jgi:HAD superfamily hydrolase (TIGR01509 family)
LFDWDGVIAKTNLDFTEVRKKYYGDQQHAMLLEDSSSLEPEARGALMSDLEEIEMRGAREARLVPGADDVLGFVRGSGIPWAVVSRNCRKSILAAAETIAVQLPPIVRSRDDGKYLKPDPRALTETCGELSVPPAQTLVIGDYIYDMQGARRAGMRGVLVRDKLGEDWNQWLECRCATMRELYRELVSPTEMVPWEYQETVRRFGVEFLRAAHKISLALPENCSPSLDVWLARAASLGVGGFVAGSGTFSPRMWRENQSIDPACMGANMHDTLEKFLCARYPFARAVKPGNSPDAVASPSDAEELAEFITSLAKNAGAKT